MVKIIPIDKVIDSYADQGRMFVTIGIAEALIEMGYEAQKLYLIKQGAIYCEGDLSAVADRFKPEKYPNVWYAPTLAVACFRLYRGFSNGTIKAEDITVEFVNKMQTEIADEIDQKRANKKNA